MLKKSRRFAAGTVFMLAALCSVTTAEQASGPDPYQSKRYPAQQISRPERSVMLDLARDGDRLVAVGERGVILISGDGGRSWRQVAVPVDVTLTGVAFSAPSHGWVVGHEATLLRTRDGGETWQVVKTEPEREEVLLDVWFQTPQRGFITGTRGLVWRTDDGGGSWNEQQLVNHEGFDPHLHAIAGLPDGTLYAAGEAGSLFRSADGEQWEALTSPYPGTFFGLTVLPGDGLLAFGMLGNAYLSVDRGATWERVDTGIDKSLFAAVQVDDRLILGGADGWLTVSPLARPLKFTAQTVPNRRAVTALLPDGPDTLVAASSLGLIRFSEP